MENFERYIINKYDSKEALTPRDIRVLVEEFEWEREEHENRRWSRWVDVVVKLEDRYFMVGYDEGLTEMQENEYDDTSIVEVMPVEKTIVVIDWVKKEED